MLESFGWAFLEKEPFAHTLTAELCNNNIAPFDTTTFEGVFPFLTSRFGKRIPTDLTLKVRRVWDVNCTEDSLNSTHKIGHIGLNLDLEIEPKLVYPSGVNKTVGYAEFKKTELDVRITQVNQTNFTIFILNGNVSEQYLHTNYIGTFR